MLGIQHRSGTTEVPFLPLWVKYDCATGGRLAGEHRKRTGGTLAKRRLGSEHCLSPGPVCLREHPWDCQGLAMPRRPGAEFRDESQRYSAACFLGCTAAV